MLVVQITEKDATDVISFDPNDARALSLTLEMRRLGLKEGSLNGCVGCEGRRKDGSGNKVCRLVPSAHLVLPLTYGNGAKLARKSMRCGGEKEFYIGASAASKSLLA